MTAVGRLAVSEAQDPQDNITAFWTMVAPGYEAHAGNVPAAGTPLYEAWSTAVGHLVPPPSKDVLDLATGTGFVALILAALGHHVTAIDLSPGMLDLATRAAAARALALGFQLGDAVDPDLERGSFDVITSRHLLWTLREPGRALKNWRALLRPGGRLLAFDGFWFDAAVGPHDDEPEPFRRHYTAGTRAALPFMHLDRVEPIVAAVEGAGFHAVAATPRPDLGDPASGATTYVITAHA
jgi:SAM-dependent methyltransferase